MKKMYLSTIVAFLIIGFQADAQSVAINNDGTTPNASAMLDVKNSNKGMLIPRVALTGTLDNTTITSPATSLMVYNTATTGGVVPGFYYWNGSRWIPVGINSTATINAPNNFVVQNTSTGEVTTKKSYGAVGVSYIIATCGQFPTRGGGCVTYSSQILGEIRLFAGNFAPDGWAFCDGQILNITSNTALFSILGTQYGGNGITTFALPDLRSAVGVHSGISTSGQSWTQGEKTN